MCASSRTQRVEGVFVHLRGLNWALAGRQAFAAAVTALSRRSGSLMSSNRSLPGWSLSSMTLGDRVTEAVSSRIMSDSNETRCSG